MLNMVEVDFRKRLFENSPLPIVVMDADTYRYIDCNRAAATIYGYPSPDAVLGKMPMDFSAVVQYDGTPSLQKAEFYIKKALQEGSVVFEWKHQRVHGEIWDAEVHLLAFTIDKKQLLQFSLVDITERKRIEAALKQSEGKYRSIVESSPMGMHLYEIKPDGRLVFTGANPAADTILGVDNSMFIGKTIEDAFPPLVATEVPQRYREVAKTGITWQTEQISYNDDKIQGAFHVVAFRTSEHCMAAMFLDITKQKQSEYELTMSEEKYRTLFATMSQGVIYQNSSGEIVSANPAAERILGLTMNQMQGRTSIDPRWKAIHEDGNDFPGETHPIIIALKTGNVVKNVVMGIYHPEKSDHVWIKVTAVPLFRQGENKPFQAYATFDDITERKLAQDAQVESEARFRQLADSTFEAIVIHEKGVLIDVNASFCRMLGYTRSEVIGKPVLELVAPESKDEVLEKIRIGYDKPYESSVIRKDGTTVLLETIGRPIDYRGRTVRVTAMRDMSDHKKAQDALRASERRFKELVRNASDSVTILDKDGIQIYVSDVVEKMLGYKPEELTNIPVIAAMIHPEDRQRVEDAFQKILLNGSGGGQYRHRHKNGSWVHLEAWGTNQLDNPDIRGVVVNVRDITERMQAAQEHEKLNHQINQMQKLESLGLLAGGIAHDFNNLLGGIFGYIDLAKSDDDTDRASGYLSKALQTIDRARALTSQLLTFAKGGAPIQKTDYLFPFVKETAEFALSGANVSCHFDVPPDLWACYFDKNQIGQVIDNIVINAQQAMPLGGTIEITARNITLADKEHAFLAKGDYVKISIKDSGIGIQKELVAKIFDPFFTTKAKGHGLGLATCYSIVKRHDGCIDVESEMGKGSTFHLYLPASTQSVLSTADAPVTMYKGSGTFLIMDDEEVMRDTLKSMLKRLGYTTVVTENGKEAVAFFAAELAAQREVTGMIFDLTVPGGMGGKEAVAEIRKLDAAMPVFVASGYADDPVMKSPAEYGFRASICKPFRMADLSEMLNTYLKKSV